MRSSAALFASVMALGALFGVEWNASRHTRPLLARRPPTDLSHESVRTGLIWSRDLSRDFDKVWLGEDWICRPGQPERYVLQWTNFGQGRAPHPSEAIDLQRAGIDWAMVAKRDAVYPPGRDSHTLNLPTAAVETLVTRFSNDPAWTKLHDPGAFSCTHGAKLAVEACVDGRYYVQGMGCGNHELLDDAARWVDERLTEAGIRRPPRPPISAWFQRLEAESQPPP